MNTMNTEKAKNELKAAYKELHTAALEDKKALLPALRAAVRAAEWEVWRQTRMVDDLPYGATNEELRENSFDSPEVTILSRPYSD